MSKVENGCFIRSSKQVGDKPLGNRLKRKCGCVEFTFDNVNWFTSRLKLAGTAIVTSSSLLLSHVVLYDSKVKLPVMFSLSIFLLFLLLKTLLFVKKETLYVIAPIGVQFITTYVVGKETVLFVPWHTLEDFVIVEIIVGQQIFFYLGLQSRTNNQDGLVILFKNTRPRLPHLEEMYQKIVEHFFS